MRIVRRILSALDGFLAPPLCPRCAHERAAAGELCPSCAVKTGRLPEEGRCSACGGPLAGVASGVCRQCAETPPPWFRGVSALDYHGEGGDLVRAYKYGRQSVLAEYFAKEMADAWLKYGRPARPQALVPVPLHWIRQARRGFNQAELLCQRLSPRLKMPVLPLLRRNRVTAHQARLDAEGRLKNLRGAFLVPEAGAAKGRSLLLVDDVMTTGATLTACAEALYAAGAAEVSVLTIARA